MTAEADDLTRSVFSERQLYHQQTAIAHENIIRPLRVGCGRVRSVKADMTNT